MTSIPDRQKIIALVNEARQAGASLKPVCELLNLHSRTLQRWQNKTGCILEDKRSSAAHPKPGNKLSDNEKHLILDTCNNSTYAQLPPSQIVPRLADQGIYLASESTFYRILRQAQQLQHRGCTKAARKYKKPNSYQALAANQVWSWDITFLNSQIRGLFFRLYLIMDIYSRKIVGWEIHESENAEHAANLIRKTCLREGARREQLVLHSDNGSPMKGVTMLAMLQKLGVVPSFSRPSVSNDNPYSESLFRTLKYVPTYPQKPFANISEAREWVHKFVKWYNEEHLHSSIGFVTPEQRHRGDDIAILQARQSLYEQARSKNPERWSKTVRNWNHIEAVWLNPDKLDRQDREELRNTGT